jgi:hypothetical protein
MIRIHIESMHAPLREFISASGRACNPFLVLRKAILPRNAIEKFSEKPYLVAKQQGGPFK